MTVLRTIPEHPKPGERYAITLDASRWDVYAPYPDGSMRLIATGVLTESDARFFVEGPARIANLQESLALATRKWTEYEQKYILPCFVWAEQLGFDLRVLVSEHPGKNCVELFAERTMAHIAELEAELAALKRGEPTDKELMAAAVDAQRRADKYAKTIAGLEAELAQYKDVGKWTPSDEENWLRGKVATQAAKLVALAAERVELETMRKEVLRIRQVFRDGYPTTAIDEFMALATTAARINRETQNDRVANNPG